MACMYSVLKFKLLFYLYFYFYMFYFQLNLHDNFRNLNLICKDKNYGNIFYVEERNLFIWERCDILRTTSLPAVLADILISKKFVLSLTSRRHTL